MVNLIQVVLAGEDRSVRNHLSQDAADGPDIDRLGIATRVQHDFGSTIPTCSDVFCQESAMIVCWVGNTSQTEVTDLLGRKIKDVPIFSENH